MEERIQQTQKMEALGTLAGGIAHDFNNILSAMLGFTELAKMRTTEDEDTQKHLSQVLSSGLRARELVRHILTFSRKSDTHKDLIRIAPLIKETVKFLKASIPPDIRIVTRLEKPDATITADPTQIHQVLMNLFTNAVQAMKENIGILTITLDTVALLNENDCSSKKMKPGPYVKLSVSDTGCGIPDHLIDKIFEPFFTTKKRGEGTGMGLSLSYGIIKDLNGQMSVYSEPGRGTTFHILIPEQKDVQVLSDLPDHAEPMMAVGNGRKVLLVDDEKKIVAWTEKVLTRLGYDVVTATGPREALKKFEKMQDSLDLVVTDLSMPEMTGIQMAGRIKKIRGDIPIILSTGFSEGLSSRELSENGISQVIMKPMIAGELASIIKKHALSKQDGHDG
jgi:CheY-like chemotaxis protein